MSLPVVEVLLSAYNGERYVHEQIRSILAQEEVRVRLVVRDDGSNDGTAEMLQSYEKDPRVVVHLAGKNLGLPQAFFELIEGSGDDADCWALADQDDVWLRHKLARAVAELRHHEEPALYCARVLVVDEDLRPLYPHPLPKRGPSFANALVQNIATGCTIVFNRAARDVLQGRWPRYAVMHDAWLYLVISGTGTVVYDPDIVVHYRQHTGNAVGMGRGRAMRTVRRIQRQLTPEEVGAHGRQDQELRRTHGELLSRPAWTELNAALLAWNGDLRSRLAYAVNGPAHRQTMGSNLVLRILEAAGRV